MLWKEKLGLGNGMPQCLSKTSSFSPEGHGQPLKVSEQGTAVMCYGKQSGGRGSVVRLSSLRPVREERHF